MLEAMPVLAMPAQAMPTLGILATPYINLTNKNSQELILDKTLLRLLAKKKINYIIIQYTISKSKLNELLNNLDGLIFPGGQAGNFYDNKFYRAYFKIQKFLVLQAQHINSVTRPFPILGICNGYENMILIERNYNITKNHIKNIFINVKCYKNYKAPLFSISKKYRNKRLHKTKKIIHNNLLAVDPKTNIGDYKIMATSLDKNNNGFIDIVKHNNYPFFGFQGHPEVNNGEMLEPFFKVVKASFNERKKASFNERKKASFNKHKRSATYNNAAIYKNSKIKTLKLRVLK
jgi:gamma-glutamyl-gamma-aminobutyrate hydrolase PuuD